MPSGGYSYIDAAEHVLREAGEPLKYTVIAERAIEQGLLVSEARSPATSMHVSLRGDMKRRDWRKAPQRFVFHRGGYFGLVDFGADQSDSINYEERRPGPSKKRKSRPPANYRSYLQSPQWKRFRGRVIKHAGYRCQKCGHKGNDGYTRARQTRNRTLIYGLQVHHLNYDRVGHEKFSDVMVLCNACHSAKHYGP